METYNPKVNTDKSVARRIRAGEVFQYNAHRTVITAGQHHDATGETQYSVQYANCIRVFRTPIGAARFLRLFAKA